jgi:23S rRNA pseudouridine1911/1915/1917 synthase
MTRELKPASLNQGWIYHDRIDTKSKDLSLLSFYVTRYAHSVELEWRDRIQAGLISVNETPITDGDFRLQPGQTLAYHRPPWVEPAVPWEIAILHEDGDIVIVHKPAGLPVLPGGGYVQHTLWGWLQEQYPVPPTPVHRLGRGTSGLMVMAKTAIAKSVLSQALRLGTMTKEYRALAMGVEMADRFTITQPIGKVPYPNLGYLYMAVEPGKAAISHCQVLQRDRIPGATLMAVTIPTGRPHQIRIHLAAAGYPLWGDPLYGIGGVAIADAVPGDCGYHLHAYQIKLTHPTQGTPLMVTAVPPSLLDYADFQVP